LHDIDFIFEGAFHSFYREFTFNPCNVDPGLVEFVSDPHPVESDFRFCYVKFNSFLTRALRSHSNEHTSYTHTHEMSAHALLVMMNLGVVEAFFEGIGEMLDGSGHTDDMGVDVGMVDGDSASGDADPASVDDANIGRKNDWDYEVMPYNAAYDGSLRAVDEAKENWRDVDLARGKGREKGKGRERR
jgi:hypothetical protein